MGKKKVGLLSRLCVFVWVVERVSGLHEWENVCTTGGKYMQSHQNRSCCSSVINHMGSDFAAATRSKVHHVVEGPQRDAHAHAHSAGYFISGVNRGWFSSCCLWISISAVINVCVNQFTNSTKQCASSRGLKIDCWEKKLQWVVINLRIFVLWAGSGVFITDLFK